MLTGERDPSVDLVEVPIVGRLPRWLALVGPPIVGWRLPRSVHHHHGDDLDQGTTPHSATARLPLPLQGTEGTQQGFGP